MNYNQAKKELLLHAVGEEKTKVDGAELTKDNLAFVHKQSALTPAILAAVFGMEKTLANMIKTDTKVLMERSDSGATPAIWAASLGHYDTLKLCIDTDPSVLEQKNNQGRTPAIWAAIKSHCDALKLCIDTDPSVLKQKDNYCFTPAMCAAAQGHCEALKLCIDSDRSVLKQQDTWDRTPAIFATANGHCDALKLCIDTDPSVLEQKDNNGSTPAIWAAEEGHCDALKLCINTDQAVVKQQNKLGRTPAIWAAIKSDYHALKLCIDTDQSVLKQQDKRGFTPTKWAAQKGHFDALKLCINTNPNAPKAVLEYYKFSDYYTKRYEDCKSLPVRIKLLLHTYRLFQSVHNNELDNTALSLKVIAQLKTNNLAITNSFLAPLSHAITGSVRQDTPPYFRLNKKQIVNLLTLIIKQSTNYNETFRTQLLRAVGHDLAIRATSCNNQPEEQPEWRALSLVFLGSIMHEEDQSLINSLLLYQLSDQQNIPGDLSTAIADNIANIMNIIDNLKCMLHRDFGLTEQATNLFLYPLSSKAGRILLDEYVKLKLKHLNDVNAHEQSAETPQAPSNRPKRKRATSPAQNNKNKLIKQNDATDDATQPKRTANDTPEVEPQSQHAFFAQKGTKRSLGTVTNEMSKRAKPANT